MILKTGDIFEIKKGDKVYTDFPFRYLYRPEWHIGHKCIEICENFEISEMKYDTTYMIGKYAVINTTSDGGGGPPGDYYPDGRHVFAKKMDKRYPVLIDFYQSGSFTAMIKDREPIGNAEIEFTVKI